MLEIVDISDILKRNMLLLLQNPPNSKNMNNENYNWKTYTDALSNLTSNKNINNNNNNLSGGRKKRLSKKKVIYKTKRRLKRRKRITKKIKKRRKN